MCVFLSSPERLPCNPLCILISLFAYLLIGLLLVSEQRGMAAISAHIFLEVITLALVAYAGLYWSKSLPRFQQTFSALVGINMVITAVAIPVVQLAANGGANADETGNLQQITELLIVIWNLAVISLIFKRAFTISTQLSAIMSFNYYVVFQFLVIWLI
jgi:hypothetical protein